MRTSAPGGHHAASLSALLVALLWMAFPPSDSLAEPALVDRDLLLGFLADRQSLTLIDARSPAEYAQQHISGAVNVPFDQLDSHAAALPAERNAPIVVYCRTGMRAELLREALLEQGYTDVRVLPRRQMFWTDEVMVFNCAVTDDGKAAAGPVNAGTTGAARSAVPIDQVSHRQQQSEQH